MSSVLGARQWNAPLYIPSVPSSPQAMYTAYPSRVRTGSTLLMQPISLAPVPPNHNPTQPAPALAHASSFGPSRRTRGGVVNYAELEDDEDENIDVEGESAGPTLTAPTGIPTRGAGELDRNYLGTIPPAKFIRPVAATRINQEYFSETRLAEAASKRAVYVPIRLELNTESHQIRDSFLWNVNETLITPAAFAQQLRHDLAIPSAQHADLIAAAILAQCEEHRWVANVRARPRRKRRDVAPDQNSSTQAGQTDAQGPTSSLVETNQQTTIPRDPRIEALRAELHGSPLVSGQSTPGTGTGTGIASASVGTSAASPASDGHVTPAPIAVNIDDELDPLNNLDGQKTQTNVAHEKQELSSAPAAATSTSQSQSKLPENGDAGDHSDDTGSEINSESDYETDSEAEEPDCRVIVNLDLQISTHHLHDHIEWDLASPLTPEHFARVLCADIGLAGEAVPLVACALREALLKHTKDALEAGLIGPGVYEGRPDSLGTSARKEMGSETLRSVFRDWQDAEEYFPRLELLSAEELERRAMERERAIRRMRRETQRWGQANVSRKRFRER